MNVLVQFFAPYRGCVWVQADSRRGSADRDGMADRLVCKALEIYNSRMPGCRVSEMTVVGMTDGHRTLDRHGQQVYPVVPIWPGDKPEVSRFGHA